MSKGAGRGEAGGAPGSGGPEHYFALPAGTKIFEFEIVSVLGHGGFGITYKAADTDLQKTVAIKEFFPNDLAGRASSVTVRAKSSAQTQEFEQGLRTFLEEARLIARFQHPNIVGVQRFFEAHGTGYIVFTYETGQTLSQRLASGPLSETELRQMLGGVLAGLEAVHEAAILHRDLKPNNIMLRGDGTPVLIDFGAARNFQHRHSRTVTAIASAGYAPPEQYGVGGQQGPWSDFYALGAIAYRCVTGVTPTESLRRLRNDPLKSAVEAARGKYDASVLRTIDWMLRVDEADRPASVAEVRAALAGGAIPVRRGNESREVVRERSRRRGFVWLTAGGVLALASAGAVAGVMLRNDPEQVKAFACAHVGLLCADRVANLPAEKEATGAPSVSASPPGSSAEPPGGDTASATSPPSAGPAASSPGSGSPATALLSAPARNTAGAEPAPKPSPSPALSEAAEAWVATKDIGSIPVLETFVARYKDTFYAEMARARIEELKKQQVAANAPPAPDETAWAKTKDSKDPEQIRAFLKQFPDSQQQAAAIARLAQLEPKVTECDELAAHPEDPRRIADVRGVDWGQIEVPKAIEVCKRLVQDFPDAPRLLYQLGRAYQKQKSYDDARRSYERAANSNYPAAIVGIGALHAGGLGVARDYEEARRWYARAAELDYAPAMLNMGNLHRYGNGVPKNHDEAKRWFMRAANLGSAAAMDSIGSLYMYGDEIMRDYAEARRWYKKGAGAGNRTSLNGLRVLYKKAGASSQEYEQLIRWFLEAAEKGDASAMYGIGTLYSEGEGVPRNFAEARQWYFKGAELGNYGSLVNLRALLKKERASSKDYDQFRALCQKLAEKGDTNAMTELGLLFANGEGGVANHAEARKWFVKAAELEDVYAVDELRNLYKKAGATPSDYDQLRAWYRRAADAGNTRAMMGMARLLKESSPPNNSEALRWLMKAADRGDGGAMNDAGVMYHNGLVGPRNYLEAQKWYMKAASLGIAMAMQNLGKIYEYGGYGLQRDRVEARKWYEKAAEKGIEESKKALQRLR